MTPHQPIEHPTATTPAPRRGRAGRRHPSRVIHHFPAPAFTLIEVILAISIASLMLGVAVIGISGVQAEAELKNNATRIETTVRAALQRAIVSQQVVHVDLSAGAFGGSGSLMVKRLGDDRFRAPRGGESWEFSPSGVCEPVELRLLGKSGTIEMGFDPLTGCATKKHVIVNG